MSEKRKGWEGRGRKGEGKREGEGGRERKERGGREREGGRGRKGEKREGRKGREGIGERDRRKGEREVKEVRERRREIKVMLRKKWAKRNNLCKTSNSKDVYSGSIYTFYLSFKLDCQFELGKKSLT